MGFLKRLFGGGQRDDAGDPDGLYFYVRSNRTGEVIKVRLHRHNDLSLMDDNKTYFTRKVIVGTKSFDRIEAEFMFDANRNLLSAEISGGELVEREDYEAFLATQEAESNSGS